jgi:hypothetical protein
MVAALGLGGFARSFHLMGIADDELTAAGIVPGKPSCIGAMRPTREMRLKGDALYRSHAREIVRRFKAGEDLDPATDAEILDVLLSASLKAPLSLLYTDLAERMFVRIYGAEAARRQLGELRDLDGSSSFDAHHRADVDAAERELRHTLRCEGRGKEP